MTMDIYAKVRGGTKRQAIARLSYGVGSRSPDHLVEFPTGAAERDQNRHQNVTSPGKAVNQ